MRTILFYFNHGMIEKMIIKAHRAAVGLRSAGERQVKDCALAHYMAAAPVVTSIIYGREPS